MAEAETQQQKIGARIHDTRIARGMSQQQLAAKANISLPHISDIERGKKAMRLETFIKIIEALQVSADEILRADVPTVRQIYQNEISDILSDCTPGEAEAIRQMMLQLSKTLRSASRNE